MSDNKATESIFDNIAEAYYSFVPPFPKEYTELVNDTFLIRENDSIIDLGCGSGELTRLFANHSTHVQGIDISKKMISMAERNDTDRRVKWLNTSVDEFDFGKNEHKLIFAFESFHLFSNQEQLIKRCAESLRPGGMLCIGWATYEWESTLLDAISETFRSCGIPWDDWGSWACPTFSEKIEILSGGLSLPQKKSIAVERSTSVENIVNYLFSISKNANLPMSLKQTLYQELKRKFTAIYPSGRSKGKSYYTILYSQKYTAAESEQHFQYALPNHKTV